MSHAPGGAGLRERVGWRQTRSELSYGVLVKDAIVLGALLLAFAALVTTHVAISARLALRARPRIRGLGALLVPPLAPWWAWAQGWKLMTWLWLGSTGVYGVALLLAWL